MPEPPVQHLFFACVYVFLSHKRAKEAHWF